MPDGQKCPICGGFWFEGECYKCGAFTENGKVVVPKPETKPVPPVVLPSPQPPTPQPPPRAWDDP